jgi:hypothetical protein
MRRSILIVISLALIPSLLAAYAFGIKYFERKVYNQLRVDQADAIGRSKFNRLKPVLVERQFVQEIEENWVCKGKYSEHLEAAFQSMGVDLNIKNIIWLFHFRMPNFSWADSELNLRHSIIRGFQTALEPISIDGKMYMTPDGCQMVIKPYDMVAIIYTQTQSGVEEAIWYKLDR